MTNLNLQQGSNVETVSAIIIKKLYEVATTTNMQNCNIEGNLQTIHCWKSMYDYFTGDISVGVKRFPNLQINVTDSMYIDFADLEMNRIISNAIGDHVGTTLANIQATDQYLSIDTLFSDINDNDLIEILDLRFFKGIQKSDSGGNIVQNTFNNISNLKDIYVKNARYFVGLRFAGINSGLTITYNGQSYKYIRNFILDNIYMDGSGSCNILGGSPLNERCFFENVAIRQPQNDTKSYKILDYTTRGDCYIENLYLDINSVVAYHGAYGDDINRILNIYVPVGMAQSYTSDASWSNWSGTFVEYDFETDPDGIFSMMNV